MKATVIHIERIKAMSDVDKQCVCGGRLSFNVHKVGTVVACIHCNRVYEHEQRDGAATNLPKAKDLPAFPKEKR